MRETLPGLRSRLGGRVALAHFDAGTGDTAANGALAAELTPAIAPQLCRGGVLVSDPPIEAAELEPLPLPDGVALGRYHLYCRTWPGLVPSVAQSIMTGTWSEALSQPRMSRWTQVAARLPTRSGVTQTWSRRRPRSLAAQSRLR